MKPILKKLILLCFFLSSFTYAKANSNKPNIKTSADLVNSYPSFTVEHRDAKGTLFIGEHAKSDQKQVYFSTDQGKGFDHVTELPFEEIISVFLYKEPASRNPVIYILGRNKHDTEMYTGFDYNFTKLNLTCDKDNILRIIHRPDPLLYQHMNCFDGVIFGKKKQCEYTNELLFKTYLDRTLNPKEEQTVISPSIPPEFNSNRRNSRPTPDDLVTSYPPFKVEYRGVRGTLFIGKNNERDEKPLYFLTNQGKNFDYIPPLPFDDIISVFLYEEGHPKNMYIYVLGRKRYYNEDEDGFDYNFTSLSLEVDKNNILRINYYPDPLLNIGINCFDGMSYGKKKRCEYTDEASFKSYLKNRYK